MTNNVVLIIGLVWPEPASSAAGKRMLQLIALFQSWGYQVTFASTAAENALNFDLSTIGIEKVTIKLNAESFDDFVKICNPSIVLFDRFVTEEQFGWRITENCPEALKVLDSEDLHCLRYTRAANFKKGVSFEIENLYEEEWTKREIASILRCDLTLIIAEYEMEVLKKYFKIDQNVLLYLPILFDQVDLKMEDSNLSFQERSDFVFIGNFWHEPNWDAVVYLKKTIWPLIRKQLPTAIIRIYGAYPSQKVFDFTNKKEGFYVEGRADSALEVISKAKVLIAPLRFGAGIKGKLLESMQFGTPSVTTSIGAESINGNLPWNGFIADDAIEFALKSISLHQYEKLWLESQKQGYCILNERFKKGHFVALFHEKLHSMLNNLASHRRKNFYGALLSHHSMNSTKFMSKWIEEKNKNSILS
ncbi:glycosyltransferase [Flavobacterium tegetincola]|uniref:glycosyltransferase n=1 Tax=Flavobacterium tegetincola TaxID=150172 RepID=UPI00042A6903|nr:glycosyltransferase [Flavobacterium tegetincola]